MSIEESRNQIEENEGGKMPVLRKENVLAVVCSDLHFSLRPPSARIDEKNWLEVQRQYIIQLIQTSEKWKCPIIIAGDIFDKPINSPELINMVIDQIKFSSQPIYAIPGQHDLLHHSIEDIRKTSYYTLIAARAIHPISERFNRLDNINKTIKYTYLVGFPWGCELSACKVPGKDHMKLAICHKYIHIKGHSFPGADPEANARKASKILQGFNFGIFGDNHSGFNYKNIFNCGTFMRRTLKEKDYFPRIGLVTPNKIMSNTLKVNGDKFCSVEKQEENKKVESKEIQDFIDSMQKMHGASKDFGEALELFIKKLKANGEITEKVQTKIQELLDAIH